MNFSFKFHQTQSIFGVNFVLNFRLIWRDLTFLSCWPFSSMSTKKIPCEDKGRNLSDAKGCEKCQQATRSKNIDSGK